MKVLLIFYGDKDVNIDGINYNKKLFIKKQPYYEFKNIEKTLKKYDYMIFLDDNWDINDAKDSINFSINLIKDYGQIIYRDAEVNGMSVYAFEENGKKYELYKSITRGNRIFKNMNKKELKQSNGIDYEQHVNCDFKINNFRLVPSIINLKIFILDDFFLKKNEHIEYLYGIKLGKSGFNVMQMNMKIRKEKVDGIVYDNRDGENMTIVTGYLKLGVKRPPKKDTPEQVYDYMEKARTTLQIPQKMVLYLSAEVVDEVRRVREELGLMNRTRIVEINEENNLYMYGSLDRVKENVEKNRSPYNIGVYICAVNSRYWYMEDAIKKNYFGTDYFAWVDFSAGHIVDIPKDMRITYSQHDKVRIAWIARHNNEGFVYNHYCLGGGIFAGHKMIMMELVKLHDEKFRELMDMGYNINDDKLLFTIMERYPYMFDKYFSGYKSLYVKI